MVTGGIFRHKAYHHGTSGLAFIIQDMEWMSVNKWVNGHGSRSFKWWHKLQTDGGNSKVEKNTMTKKGQIDLLQIQTFWKYEVCWQIVYYRTFSTFINTVLSMFNERFVLILKVKTVLKLRRIVCIKAKNPLLFEIIGELEHIKLKNRMVRLRDLLFIYNSVHV